MHPHTLPLHVGTHHCSRINLNCHNLLFQVHLILGTFKLLAYEYIKLKAGIFLSFSSAWHQLLQKDGIFSLLEMELKREVQKLPRYLLKV